MKEFKVIISPDGKGPIVRAMRVEWVADSDGRRICLLNDNEAVAVFFMDKIVGYYEVKSGVHGVG